MDGGREGAAAAETLARKKKITRGRDAPTSCPGFILSLFRLLLLLLLLL
jgi:hypothetical protein